MGYQVGQILFVVPREKTAVVPVQVVEEITKKSLQGERVSHIVRYGQDPKKTVDINEIDGEIYDSSDHVKRVLIERSTMALNRLVNNAVEKAGAWYAGAFESPSAGTSDELASVLTGVPDSKPRDERGRFVPQQQSPVQEGEGATVTLEDGTVARVKLPPELQG